MFHLAKSCSGCAICPAVRLHSISGRYSITTSIGPNLDSLCPAPP
jgi:hypothetical protein